MAPSPTEQHPLANRRVLTDRRAAEERRSGDRRFTLVVVEVERRAGADRRGARQRRGTERRAQETASTHMRHALQLIAQVAESDALDDELRRDLDAALFRLRFALDRLERKQ
jgi:hypothetical protein